MEKLSADMLKGNPVGFRADKGGTDTIDQLANKFDKCDFHYFNHAYIWVFVSDNM